MTIYNILFHFVCGTGLESLSLILALTTPSVFDPLTLSMTMQWCVVGMEIESPDTTTLGTLSTQLLNQLPFPLIGRSHHWCLALSPVQVTRLVSWSACCPRCHSDITPSAIDSCLICRGPRLCPSLR